ncbi:hypothetical protein ABTL45_19585, partial [Acinetobacter baumannii]
IVLHPANDYVREFVANVNPLNVLTAYNVLRDVRDLPRDADGWIELQAKPANVRLKLDDAGKVAAASVHGVAADWLSVEDAGEDLPH